MNVQNLNTQEEDGGASKIVPFPQKVYVDGNTLIDWLNKTYDLRADRSKLVDLRREGMPKRVYSPRCIRYNLDGVAAWMEERGLGNENTEELKLIALREARLQAHQKRMA